MELLKIQLIDVYLTDNFESINVVISRLDAKVCG